MNEKPVTCPHCKAMNEPHPGTLYLHEGGQMCGCDTCKSLFRYPSMIPFPTMSVGTPNPSALWDLVEYIAEIEAAEVPS